MKATKAAALAAGIAGGWVVPVAVGQARTRLKVRTRISNCGRKVVGTMPPHWCVFTPLAPRDRETRVRHVS